MTRFILSSVFVVYLSCISFPSFVLASSSEEQFKEICDMWGKDDPIASYKIKFFVFRAMSNLYIKSISLEDFQKVVSDCREQEGIKEYKLFIQKCTDLMEQNKSMPYAKCITIKEGAKKRSDYIDVDNKVARTEIINGDTAISTSPKNSQVCVMPVTKHHVFMEGLASFRIDPTPFLSCKVLPDIEQVQKGVVSLKFPGSSTSYLVQTNTGAILCEKRVLNLKDRNEVRLRIQSDFMANEYLSNQPRITINARFSNGILCYIEGYFIEDMQLNCKIEKSAFELAAKTKTKVFDFRPNPDDPAFTRLEKDANNVLTEINDNAPGSLKKKNPFSVTRMAFIVFGLLLIGFVVFRKFGFLHHKKNR